MEERLRHRSFSRAVLLAVILSGLLTTSFAKIVPVSLVWAREREIFPPQSNAKGVANAEFVAYNGFASLTASFSGVLQGSASCDLSISKTMSSPIQSGGTATILLTVTNVGTAPCGDPHLNAVTDSLPQGFSAYPPVGAPAGWNCSVSQNGGLVSCSSLLQIQPNQSISISFQVTVSAPPGSTLQNCATVDNAADQNSSNNQSCITTPVSGSPCDLQITKTISPSSVASGSMATVTLTIVNVGQTTCGATGAVVYPTTVSDNFPAGMTANPGGVSAPAGWSCLISNGGATVTCTSTTQSSSMMPPNTPITITIAVTVSGTPGSTIINCASVSNPYDQNPANDQSCAQMTVSSPPAVSCAAINGTGLVAWWPMDETSGTTVADIVGGHDGATASPIGSANGPVAYPGEVGGSILTSGTQRVDVPNSQALDPGAGDFTIDAWVYYVPAGDNLIHWASIASKSTATIGYYLQIVDYSSSMGQIEFGLLGPTNSAAIQSVNAVPVTPNSWHHIAATLQSSQSSGSSVLRLYLDGSQKRIAGVSYLGAIYSASDLLVGKVTPGATKVAVDDLELWNRTLTLSEVQAIYAAASAGKCPTGVTSVPEFPSSSPIITVIGILLALFVTRPQNSENQRKRPQRCCARNSTRPVRKNKQTFTLRGPSGLDV